jgi:Glycosyl transferase family 2
MPVPFLQRLLSPFGARPRRPSVYPNALGVLGIMKNESGILNEWIRHYLAMGAGKIYLIDNGSTDDTVAKARAWEDRGVVRLVEYHGRHQQPQHYWRAFQELGIGEACKWLLIADLDEFWFCPDGARITTRLDGLRGLDVIYANWRMFGSNGLDRQPPSVREGFTLAAPGVAGHGERKYICRTAVVTSEQVLGVHSVTGACSSRTVSDNQTFHLNHYPIQSREFFGNVKMTRGAADHAHFETVRDWDYFARYDAPCTVEDRLLADLVAKGALG